MNRMFAAALVLMVACLGARGQTFPYEDDFTTYHPGSTGAPAWSALHSLQWNPDTGTLYGPVFARYNLRPPIRYTAEITLAAVSASGPASWSAGFVFNGQDEKEMHVADGARLMWTRGASGVTVQLCTLRDGIELTRSDPIAIADGPVSFRLAVDAETGRFAAFLGDAKVYSGCAEYAAGLLAVSLEDDQAALHRFSLRASSADEKNALTVTTLFNDPRDIADGGNGTVLVLHRGSPAVLALTPDGEVVRSFGRRIPAGIMDPVAMVLSTTGVVLVLNRFPGEIVEYDHNGGIRGRFGKGKLVRPVDLATLPTGAVYVADEGSNKIVVFGADGAQLGSYSCEAETPEHLGADSIGRLVVSYLSGKCVSFQVGSKPADLTVAHEYPVRFSAVTGTKTASWACLGSLVTAWPPPADPTGFTGKAVGGVGTGGRLTMVGETLYLLDRAHSRVVSLPADVRDIAPEVTFQNIEGSAALLRWESTVPALDSRVHLLRGSTWDTVVQKNVKPATKHQVPLAKLKPGLKYRYTLSPTVSTIPASDWSAEYTFETPGGATKP